MPPRRRPSPSSPRSPYISSRPPTLFASNPRSPSNSSSTLEDVLFPGDIVGEHFPLQGEPIRLVSIGRSQSDVPQHEKPANEFEVIRRLGAGSYAVVYLVSEVLYRPPPSEDGHVGHLDIDPKSSYRPSTVYGRQYAVKCLSKANLDQDALAAQMSEVTIHQSLRPHPNIVTLHRTFETSSFLLLLLEYVPGEDLFYFLEQSRDHYQPPDSISPSPSHTSSAESYPSTTSRTPPTPSLLASIQPNTLLSRTRLRLIASMFAQMCEAVAACHAQQVFHRDIKPENFIVTDGWSEDPANLFSSSLAPQRKVVVKLTDFGLSTTDIESSDMDCGSAPYMSYECRNNIAPTYRPRGADVWSLGIVFINMLYHVNPWTDTAQGACSSFQLFRQHPLTFFMNRFPGMTRPVAEMLAYNVFTLLDEDGDDSKRITAKDFGIWVKQLPELLGEPQPKEPAPTGPLGHKRVTSISSVQGFALSSSTPVSHRPTSRTTSRSASAVRAAVTNGVIQPRSRASSLAYDGRPERVASELASALGELSTVIDQELEEADENENEDVEPEPVEMEPGVEYHDADVQVDDDFEEVGVIMMTSRSTSTKRRKRGARKGKAATAAAAANANGVVSAPTSPGLPLTLQTTNLPTPMSATATTASSMTVATPITPADSMLDCLAIASQSLAREISKASRDKERVISSAQSVRSVGSNGTTISNTSTSTRGRRKGGPYEPPSMFAVPTALCSGSKGDKASIEVGSSGASVRSNRSTATKMSSKAVGTSIRSATSVTSSTQTPIIASPGTVPPVPPIPTQYSSVGIQQHIPAAPTKKPSKWKLGFGKASSTTPASIDTSEDVTSSSPHSSVDLGHSPSGLVVPPNTMSATASNVTTLIMGLNPTPPPSLLPQHSPIPHTPYSAPAAGIMPSHRQMGVPASDESLPHSASLGTWRGRQVGRALPPLSSVNGSSSSLQLPLKPGQSPGLPVSASVHQDHSRSRGRQQALHSNGSSPHPSVERWGHGAEHEKRTDRSPNSLRAKRTNGSFPSSSASSVISGVSHFSSGGSSMSSNWRNSTSSAASSALTSTSAFTKYSNSSTRSVSTANTSVSSGSWRAGKLNTSPTNPNTPYSGMPRNIKPMDGVPWELNQLPRGQHPNPDFGQPPVRKQRNRKPKDLTLDTITERPGVQAARKSPDLNPHSDAMTSTTDLEDMDGDSPKKVQKGQINALAKMLSAWSKR